MTEAVHDENDHLRKKILDLQVENALLRQQLIALKDPDRKEKLEQAESNPDTAIPEFPIPEEDSD